MALAQDFATNEPRGIAYYLKDYAVRHVNGSQNSGERSQLITAFANSTKSVITNARCLTEGVNIPAVDMVAFIDPRQSKVDITQAVGRAMRKPRGASTKTVGYVLVPLFAGVDGEGLEEAIKTEKFDAIADVLNALQEHDEELVDIIRELQERKGQGKVFDPKRLLEKVEVIGPMVGLDELARSISVAITDSLGVSWDEWFGSLLNFKEREGHCNVRHEYAEASGIKLGHWVASQRALKAKLSSIRKGYLDKIGFDWDPYATQWEKAYSLLKDFARKNKHCLVPDGYIDSTSFSLGTWVSNQRIDRKKLTVTRTALLDEINFEWDPRGAKWRTLFGALERYKVVNNNCFVPASYIDESGHALGRWVSKQRSQKATLLPERSEKLTLLGFEWDPRTALWYEGYLALKAFQILEKHCNVPHDYVSPDGYTLARWLSKQRANLEAMPVDKLELLEEIGLDLNPLETRWNKGFEKLKQYILSTHKSAVPRSYIDTSGYKLGQWVHIQRHTRKSMPDERRRLLDSVNFDWGYSPTAKQSYSDE